MNPYTSLEDTLRHSRRCLLAGSALGVAAALFLLPQAASATPGGPGAPPPHPTIGQNDTTSAPLTVDPAGQPTKPTSKTLTAAAYPTSKILSVTYQRQQTSYWCGPTSLAVVLGYEGIGWSGTQYQQQSAAASLLGTTTDGTPWYGSDNVPSFPYGSWYPMQDAANYKIYKKYGSTWYDVVPLPDSPTSAQITTFKNNLMFDVTSTVYKGTGMVLEANEYAIQGYHIGKQPQNNGTIMHWLAPNGYQNSGGTTVFEDPGWGAGSASYDTTHDVVVAVGGRGYVW